MAFSIFLVRHILKVLLGLALLCGGSLVLSGCVWHSRANYEKVREGMTREQVEAILGKPWGHDDNEAKYFGFDGDFEIEYDDQGRVKDKDWD